MPDRWKLRSPPCYRSSRTRCRLAKQKITSLQEELKAKLNAVSSAEKALEEAREALDDVRAQYVEEAASTKKLEDELKTMMAKLVDAKKSFSIIRMRIRGLSLPAKVSTTNLLTPLHKRLRHLNLIANDCLTRHLAPLPDWRLRLVTRKKKTSEGTTAIVLMAGLAMTVKAQISIHQVLGVCLLTCL